ncbi:MAG: prepilin-type N-terminal cleavage/methylation domain-containing protein [Synergistaceae bacterium]|nr:prepilin-type N-terminal cleavage/methylation domain-containing protein [Synergistaceae bacterium]
MRKGFTLVEILVAVMLMSMVTTLALVPVVRTVSRVVQVQESYMDVSALSRVVRFIERDLNSAIRTAPNVITIVDHEAANRGDDDTLMIMSTSPIMQGQSAGTLVYKIEEGGILHNNVIPGLYRWVFPGKTPNMIDIDDLNGEYGQLVLPGLQQFRVEVPSGSKLDGGNKNYRGLLPAGLYIKLSRRAKDVNNNSSTTSTSTQSGSGAKESGGKSQNEYESIVVFP